MDFLEEEFDEILNVFRDESEEHIQKINQYLLKLEKEPENKEVISVLFREAHSLKGAARMIGLDDIQLIAHKLEDVLGFAKDDELEITAQIIDSLCKTVDCVATLIDESVKTKGKTHSPEVDDIVILLQQIANINNELEAQTPELTQNIVDELIYTVSTEKHLSDKDLNAHIEFVNSNILSLNENSTELNKSLTSIINSIENSSDLKNIYEKISQILKNLANSSIYPEKELLDLIQQSAESAGKMLISPLSNEENAELIMQRLLILEQMLDISQPQNVDFVEIVEDNNIEENLSEKTEIAVLNESIPRNQPVSDFHNESLRSRETGAIKTLRVDTRKLDHLINQVGELIVSNIKAKQHLREIEKISTNIEDWYRSWNKSRQSIKYFDNENWGSKEYYDTKPLNKDIYLLFERTSQKMLEFINEINALHHSVQEGDTRLNLIVNEIEQMVKSIRVLPFATIFHMFPRMVRDISRAKGKEVELIVSGSETSADKKIIEEIKSPLTHVIRNSIDHGIETPEERIINGKDPVGKIFLSAYHLENSVLVEIIDDGRGVDIEKIKRKALQKGLLSPAELDAMTENQIMNMIFLPGFSTGDSVTDISGRGIGLDVVHTKINQLNGKVNIYSTFGQGCKVSIQLPVTMATVKSFLVEVNNQTFAIPTSVIKTVSWINCDDIFNKEGKKTIIINNDIIPIFKLSDILEMPGINPCEEKTDKRIIVLVIQTENTQAGFIIDKLIGEQEILHKNLKPPLLRVRNVAGVTSLGSGELCLILNMIELVKSAFASQERLSPQDSDTSSIELQLDKEVAFRKSRILIVDDSVTTRILERNILKAAGYNVGVATNGLEALTKIASEKFDLIISDVEMPEMNGFELAKRIRAEQFSVNIPIILVTSLAREEDRKKGLEAGVNAYITKGNFDQKNLLSTVRTLLNS